MLKGYTCIWSPLFLLSGHDVKFRVTMGFRNDIAKRVINMIIAVYGLGTGILVKTRNSMTKNSIFCFVFQFVVVFFCLSFYCFFSEWITAKCGMSWHIFYWIASLNSETCMRFNLHNCRRSSEMKLFLKNCLLENWFSRFHCYALQICSAVLKLDGKESLTWFLHGQLLTLLSEIEIN